MWKCFVKKKERKCWGMNLGQGAVPCKILWQKEDGTAVQVIPWHTGAEELFIKQ